MVVSSQYQRPKFSHQKKSSLKLTFTHLDSGWPNKLSDETGALFWPKSKSPAPVEFLEELLEAFPDL